MLATLSVLVLSAGSMVGGEQSQCGLGDGGVTCRSGTLGPLDLGQVVQLQAKWSQNLGLSLVGGTVCGETAWGHMAGTTLSWVGVSGPDPDWDGASEGKVVEGSVGRLWMALSLELCALGGTWWELDPHGVTARCGLLG